MENGGPLGVSVVGWEVASLPGSPIPSSHSRSHQQKKKNVDDGLLVVKHLQFLRRHRQRCRDSDFPLLKGKQREPDWKAFNRRRHSDKIYAYYFFGKANKYLQSQKLKVQPSAILRTNICMTKEWKVVGTRRWFHKGEGEFFFQFRCGGLLL